MTKTHILAAVIFLPISLGANATVPAGTSYVGANAANLTISPAGEAGDISLRTAYGRFGDRISDNLSLELRFGTGTENAEIGSGAAMQAEVSVDKFYGVYVLGGVPVTEYLYPYVIVGFSKMEIEEVGAFQRDDKLDYNPSSLSVGVGFNFSLGKNFVLNAEWSQLIKDDGLKVAGPSLGVAYQFKGR